MNYQDSKSLTPFEIELLLEMAKIRRAIEALKDD
jgi:hypothetical protein